MKNRPIAMKCNQEQFDSIKPKLEGLEIEDNIRLTRSYPYLNNEYCSALNFIGASSITRDREIHETRNEQIFLEACGIEVEKPKDVFEITKEQICKLFNTYGNDKNSLLQEYFPQVFEEEKKEVVLEDGKWYKIDTQREKYLLLYSKHSTELFAGFMNGKWDNLWLCSKDCNQKLAIEATSKEVEESLINEAEKRYKEGDWFKCFNQDEFIKLDTGFKAVFIETEGFWHGGGIVMKKGIWATVVEKEITHNGLTYVLKN